MPITEDIKIERKEAKAYPPLPSDVYTCEVLDVSSEKRATYDTKNKPDNEKEYETVFNFQFTILDEALRVRNIWANFVPTYLYIGQKNGKNQLYRIIEALQGHEITPEEEATFDASTLNNFIGHQCRVFVETVTKGDKTYDKAVKFLPALSRLPSLTAEEKDKATVKNKPKEQEKSIDQISKEMQEPKLEEPPF